MENTLNRCCSMACVRGLKWREDGCTGEPGQSGQQGSPSITSRTYARMGRREHNGQKSPSAGRAISLSEGHAPGHALANQLAALPLFSFEFTRSSTSVGFFFPPLASGFGARRAREGWLGRCKLFFARLEFPRSCGYQPHPLLFQDSAAHICPREPASALFIRGGLGPIDTPTEQIPTQCHWGLQPGEEEKSKKVRGAHFASPG